MSCFISKSIAWPSESAGVVFRERLHRIQSRVNGRIGNKNFQISKVAHVCVICGMEQTGVCIEKLE